MANSRDIIPGQVTVVALLVAKAGEERRVLQELENLLADTRAEKGCINYDLHRDPDDARKFLFYENWESEDDLEAHLGSAHIAAWFELSKEVLSEPIQITRWVKSPK